MKFYILKTSLSNYPEKLYRKLIFNASNDLDELAFTIMSIYNTMAYHMYMFEDDNSTYYCQMLIDDGIYDEKEENMYGSSSVTLDKLHAKSKKFKMLYDFGEEYEFDIEILEVIETNKYFKTPIVTEGSGYGILEDDKHNFIRYLEGEHLEHPLYFYKNNNFVELDFNDFNLEECNKKLKKKISIIRRAYTCYD